jgi:ABC-type glutathione transport system ATPase component
MIALVGVDGSGKSTQARALARRLTARATRASYQGAGQCSALQGGGEGPRGRAG